MGKSSQPTKSNHDSTTTKSSARSSSSWWVILLVLILSNFLVFQMTTLNPYQQNHQGTKTSSSSEQDMEQTMGSMYTTDPLKYPLLIPRGYVPNMPSVRINDTTETTETLRADKSRMQYGGRGDKLHLGGFTNIDPHGLSPAVFREMVSFLGVRSVMDVGCGRGISTSWFVTHLMPSTATTKTTATESTNNDSNQSSDSNNNNNDDDHHHHHEWKDDDVLCIEGSHDAVEQTMLPHPQTQVIEHDYSRGPWWPSDRTYDAVWCVEFLEHVGRNFQKNYVPTFRKAAFLFVTHSHWGGWHHVEVHDDEWWISRFRMYGFVYSGELTSHFRRIAKTESDQSQQLDHDHKAASSEGSPNGTTTTTGSHPWRLPSGHLIGAQHIWVSLLVFINPPVASLPEHAHLLAEDGCYEGRKPEEEGGGRIYRPCGLTNPRNGRPAPAEETPLPPAFRPIVLTDDMDEAWAEIVKKHVKPFEGR